MSTRNLALAAALVFAFLKYSEPVAITEVVDIKRRQHGGDQPKDDKTGNRAPVPWNEVDDLIGII